MEFTIADVADLLGIKRLTDGNSFNVVCPFCGDTRGKMNFRIMKNGQLANTYNGYCCFASGNMLTLYADLNGIYGEDRYKIAYREIKEALNQRDGGRKPKTAAPIRPVSAPEETTAGLEARNQVYRRLIEMLTLSETHKKKLMERGLTEKQIKDFLFRSTPNGGTESLARRLIKEGYVLAGIPGFFINDRKDWDLSFYRRNRGILCPAYAITGEIAGFQIRLDEPYDDRKYIWLSSANKPRGASSKSPVCFAGNPYDKTIRVTEGILKPVIAHALSGYSMLGTPGVNQYRELEQALIVLKRNGLETVEEAYDMDKFLDIRCFGDYKTEVCKDCAVRSQSFGVGICEKKERKRDQIREGCCRLYEICGRLDLSCTRKVWDQNEAGLWAGNDKGIDDYWWSCRKKRKERSMDACMDRTSDNRGGLPPYEKKAA